VLTYSPPNLLIPLPFPGDDLPLLPRQEISFYTSPVRDDSRPLQSLFFLSVLFFPREITYYMTLDLVPSFARFLPSSFFSSTSESPFWSLQYQILEFSPQCNTPCQPPRPSSFPSFFFFFFFFSCTYFPPPPLVSRCFLLLVSPIDFVKRLSLRDPGTFSRVLYRGWSFPSLVIFPPLSFFCFVCPPPPGLRRVLPHFRHPSLALLPPQTPGPLLPLFPSPHVIGLPP